MKLHDYRYLLFDADNTLLDFRSAERNAFFAAMGEAGVPLSEETYGAYVQINQALWTRYERGDIDAAALQLKRFETLAPMAGTRGQWSPEALNRLYERRLAEQSCLMEGALELCRLLHGTYRIVVITNAVAATQRSRLEHAAIRPYLDELFISGETGAPKPSPVFFEKVLAGTGDLDKSRYLIIGDSLSSDIQGGVNAGIDTCWFNPEGRPVTGSARPTYCISNLAMLPELLKWRASRMD